MVSKSEPTVASPPYVLSVSPRCRLSSIWYRLYRKPGADRLECFGDPAIRPYVERLMKHFGVIAWIMSDLLPFAPGFDIVFVYYNETRFLLIGVG